MASKAPGAGRAKKHGPAYTCFGEGALEISSRALACWASTLLPLPRQWTSLRNCKT